MARQDKARQGKAREGKARQGKTRQGKAREDKMNGRLVLGGEMRTTKHKKDVILVKISC
jgi:hypothetical protein